MKKDILEEDIIKEVKSLSLDLRKMAVKLRELGLDLYFDANNLERLAPKKKK